MKPRCTLPVVLLELDGPLVLAGPFPLPTVPVVLVLLLVPLLAAPLLLAPALILMVVPLPADTFADWALIVTPGELLDC